jgi:hypothetical protein
MPKIYLKLPKKGRFREKAEHITSIIELFFNIVNIWQVFLTNFYILKFQHFVLLKICPKKVIQEKL